MNVRRYKNPPIVDAACEFRFVVSNPDDAFLKFKYFQEAASKSYPGKPKLLTSVNIEAGTTSIPDHPLKIQQQAPRIQLFDDSGTKLATASITDLLVGTLKPYEGWSKMLPRIEETLDTYLSIFKPKSLSRVGVRYINKIQFPPSKDQNILLDEYLRFGVQAPFAAAHSLQNFFCRGEYVISDNVVGAVVVAPDQQATETLGAILDIDVIKDFTEQAELSMALPTAKELRDIERELFESCITDKLRDVFDS